MTDYSKMSDGEINWQVAFHIGLRTVELAEEGEFDPCNNPADAWPIITDMRPIIIPERSKSGKWSIGVNIGKTLHEIDRKDNNLTYVDANLLRGCMIVFLMMKDAQSKN